MPMFERSEEPSKMQLLSLCEAFKSCPRQPLPPKEIFRAVWDPTDQVDEVQTGGGVPHRKRCLHVAPVRTASLMSNVVEKETSVFGQTAEFQGITGLIDSTAGLTVAEVEPESFDVGDDERN